MLAFVVAVLPTIAIGVFFFAAVQLAEAWAYRRPTHRRWFFAVVVLAFAQIPFSSVASFAFIVIACGVGAVYIGRAHRRAHEGRGKPPWAPGEGLVVTVVGAGFGLGLLILASLALFGLAARGRPRG